ncbi:TonB-dependent receptor plug domain-containing protein [Nitritalea halalkaliphila]|uniref:TonB-dependent receptor plug domain-containing protein n=1 Tax=Nitritalea halalkaliphila TaxID=590849 RepID=UPI001EE6592F|nr:TonB-dependent receptor [Nitritalea halalkaliphila]
MDYLPDSRSQIDWGFHTQYYNFAPIDLRPAPGSIIEPIETNPNLGIQQNFFLQGSRELTERFSVEGGLRWSLYGRVGPGVQFLYENDLPNPELPPIDTLQFGALDLMKFYQGFEPRVGMRYLLGPSTSLKAAFNRNFQYVQVAANSSAGLPIDRWVPAGPYIEPVRADQIAAGVFQNLADNKWELSVEGFYKDFRNIIDLRQGANVLFNDAIETEILTGNGYAYGVEFLLRKNVGKTNGWLSYTYSRTWRVIDGISLGQRFNPRFDRPHDLALVLNHTFNERWSGNVNFIYTTGQAVTFPIGAYIVDNQRVPLFSDLRNEDRFPDYHRLDFSINYKVPDRGRKWRSSWNFSMYNAYGRRNPFSYQFTEIVNDDLNFAGSPDEIVSRRPAIVMTYLFTFLPALSYNFEF